MNQERLEQRLSRIATVWTLVAQAHAGSTDAAAESRRVLLQRYWGAVYYYLLGAARSEETAGELCQEFAQRFLRGDFRRADPQRGRFRDYLKRALSNLVTDYFREQRAQPRPLPPDLAEPRGKTQEDADAFLCIWREDLIARSWAALSEHNATLHTVLAFHVQHAEMTSPQVAEKLSAQLAKPLSAGNVRVILKRARDKFADLLLHEVATSLEDPTDEQLLREVRALDLHRYCAGALGRRGLPIK